MYYYTTNCEQSYRSGDPFLFSTYYNIICTNRKWSNLLIFLLFSSLQFTIHRRRKQETEPAFEHNSIKWIENNTFFNLSLYFFSLANTQHSIEVSTSVLYLADSTFYFYFSVFRTDRSQAVRMPFRNVNAPTRKHCHLQSKCVNVYNSYTDTHTDPNIHAPGKKLRTNMFSHLSVINAK